MESIVVEEAVVAESALLYLYRVLRGIFSSGFSSSKYWLYRPRRFLSGKAISSTICAISFHMRTVAGANIATSVLIGYYLSAGKST